MAFHTLERKTFPAGTTIIQKGDKADSAYVVDSGLVEIYVESGGRRQVLAEVGVGGIFGEMALIDSAPRSANAVAVRDTTCIVIPEKTIQDKLAKADPLVQGLLRVLVRNVRAADSRLAPAE